MKKINKIKFSKKVLLKAESTAHRKALIESGLYAVPTHKVHKNKKKYDRNKMKRINDI